MAKSGRVMKVMTADAEGNTIGEWSQQLEADPFKSYGSAGLQEPPYPLEQLVFLAEQHPVHSAILAQKAADVVGTGWEWEAEDQKENPTEDERQKLNDWLVSLENETGKDETGHEILLSAWDDMETIGHGVIELARDLHGNVTKWYSMPSHTTRFAKDGIRIAQMRGGKRRWFKRWIPDDTRVVDGITGKVAGNANELINEPANELLVLRRPSRRSSWYGVPTYVPSIGWIVLSLAARDDNIFFFQNRREPRWAIILENVEDTPELEEELRKALAVDHREPHRNLIIPLAGGGKATFTKLGDNRGDMSFEKLQERADKAILTGHRAPGERIGLVFGGALGGSTVSESAQVYKESFIVTSQTLLMARMNRFIRAESKIDESKNWKWRPVALDLTEEGAVQQNAVRGFQGGIFRLDEAREKAGEEKLPDDDPRGEKFFWELSTQAAGTGGEPVGTGNGDGSNNAGGSDGSALANAQKQLAEQVGSLSEEREREQEEDEEH